MPYIAKPFVLDCLPFGLNWETIEPGSGERASGDKRVEDAKESSFKLSGSPAAANIFVVRPGNGAIAAIGSGSSAHTGKN